MLVEMPLGEYPQAVSAQLFLFLVFFVIHALKIIIKAFFKG
jgi:hypothetical protein